MIKVFLDLAWTTCYIFSGDFLSAEENHKTEWKNWQNRILYTQVLIPLICLFPLLIRFLQCVRRYMDTKKRFPNLANALKYALSQTVTLFGAFHPLILFHERHENAVTSLKNVEIFQMFWFGLFILSSLYSFVWDVYMDWGLGR
mmetsp:Transcript_20257/g.45924  ORF Transcript_20257/g.45924 Transcript_20257/m.45924 type:complete len:144 (-) Transcript_20257:1146-1577(-)